MAGGSGTRLWPMSTTDRPKQLIPFLAGRSLLQISMDRLDGLVDADRRCVCAGESHRAIILQNLPGLSDDRYFGEPMGRDTLNAVGLSAALIAQRDPHAVIATFTADHIIEPVPVFQRIVRQGFELAERHPELLVTFGIRPTFPATGYGYLELGDAIEGELPGAIPGVIPGVIPGARKCEVDFDFTVRGELPGAIPGAIPGARKVRQFREKPDALTAQQYLDAGPTRYLWNSGMFIWHAATLLRCMEKFAPENFRGLMRIAAGEPIAAVYPTLPKISVDYAVMEPAGRDSEVSVATLAMDLTWLDVGSWPSYAKAHDSDVAGNARSHEKSLLLDCTDTLAVSEDPDHIIAAVGVKNLVIVHTPRATLVCPQDQAERIKELHKQIGEKFGKQYL